MDLPNGKVFGTGCILDTSRLVRSIANYTNLNIEAIKCNIAGEHGNSQFPVWSRLSIAGLPMWEYCQNVGLPWGNREKDLIFNQDSFELLQDILEDADELDSRTPYGDLVTTEFAKKAVK